MKYDTATPYTASYVVLRKGDKVAFVLRSNTAWMNSHYGLPSGKVEVGESFRVAAIREGKEEVGVTIKPENLRPVLTVHRNDDDSYWVDQYFEVVDWEGEAHNAEPHMHSEVAWLDLNNLPDNIIPSVRRALEQITTGNSYFEEGWV